MNFHRNEKFCHHRQASAHLIRTISLKVIAIFCLFILDDALVTMSKLKDFCFLLFKNPIPVLCCALQSVSQSTTWTWYCLGIAECECSKDFATFVTRVSGDSRAEAARWTVYCALDSVNSHVFSRNCFSFIIILIIMLLQIEPVGSWCEHTNEHCATVSVHS